MTSLQKLFVSVAKSLVALTLMLSPLGFGGSANAGPITGDTVVGARISGGWDGIPGGPQTIPTGYSLGFFGIGILSVGLDGDGVIRVTPNGGSCGSGCGWNFGGPEVFRFTLDPSAPLITGLITTSSAASIGVSFSLVDSKSFDINVSGQGSGTTNHDVTLGQLSFAVATPLPATLPLFASGLAGLGWLARRKRKPAA